MEEMRAGDPSAKLMVMCIISFIRGPEWKGGGGRINLVVVPGRSRESMCSLDGASKRKHPDKAPALVSILSLQGKDGARLSEFH